MTASQWVECCYRAGPSTVAFLANPANTATVQVMFLDIMMPGLTGIQVMEALSDDVKRSVRVIATTGSVEDDSIAEMR